MNVSSVVGADPLSRIRFVLVEPTHPGNIGGVARAMKNSGLSELALVKPRRFPDPEAEARAAGAEDVLARARLHASLDEALGDCHLVVGTSARTRTIPMPPLLPDVAARKLLEGAAVGQVALLFGRESSGLSNAELDRCQYLVTIPANPAFSSLNLACASQVLAYEILRHHLALTPSDMAPGRVVVGHDRKRHFYHHLESVLVAIEFLDPKAPRKLMRRLQRVFERSELDDNEMNILEGVLTAMERQLFMRARNT